MPPTLYVEDPDDEFDYLADWKEAIENQQPGGGVAASATAQDAVLVGIIPFNKVRSAQRYFLGYSYADEAAPYALHREPPARHPLFPSLYAHSFAAVGLAPQSNPANPNREPYKLSPFTGTDGLEMYYADYQKAVCTVRYRSFGRLRFLADDDVAGYLDEYKRWVRFNTDPKIEALTADGTSQLVFREGGGDPDPTAGATPFPAPVAELMAKAALVMKWYNVPFEYVSSDPDLFKPDKILARLGTVNQTAFLGFYPGQLLLTAVGSEDTLFPVAAADPDGFPVTGLDLTLAWEFFEPNRPYAGTYHGHRLFPWRKTGKWYYATRENSGDELLPLTDHWKVFQHVADPS